MKESNFIGRYAIFATIIVTVLGEGIFSYPREITSYVSTNGWITTLLSGVVAYAMLHIIYKTIDLNNYASFEEILYKNFGKALGKIISIIFVIYNVVYAGTGVRIFAEVLKMYLLEKTPIEFIIALMILMATYLVNGGLHSVIKFNEVSFWIMFVPIAVVLFFAAGKAEFANVLPLVDFSKLDYIKGEINSLYAFASIQIAFMIIPRIRHRENLDRVLKKSVIFITGFYLVVLFLTIGVFGKDQTSIILWPTLTLIKSIDIPGGFIERWEGIVMSFWILFYFTTFINIYYFSSRITTITLNLRKVSISTLFIAPTIYVISLFPDNIAKLYELQSKFLYIFALVVSLVIPIILFIISKTKSVKEKREVRTNES